MKFNSQICTTRVQSEQLLALGLKKETADMCINLSHESELAYSFSYSEALSLYHNYGLDRITNTDLLLPAWSLHRLIEILNGVSELEITRFGSGWGVYDELRAFTSEELIDALYDMVVQLKEEGVI